MTLPKVIKTEADHHAALARIEEIFQARPGTPEGDELDLLLTLVDLYESQVFPIDLPDPVAAIRFRMDQQGLKAKDLIPYIGSASKVSEVLSGQRTLSLTMIRQLVAGLGLPARVLVQGTGTKFPSEAVLQQADRLPVAEMVRRGWFAGFQGSVPEAKKRLPDLLNDFVGTLGTEALLPGLNRQHVCNGADQNEAALLAWRIRVANLARRETIAAYVPGAVTMDFLRQLARLSYLDSGPRLAREFLNKSGIHLICERHLPGTYLDGAALRLPNRVPVVALTLRHDRLDNFWFTLFHELAHVSLHLDGDDVEAFFDDLANCGQDQWENEADKLAREALIPAAEWNPAGLSKDSTPEEVTAFAARLRISPAIPAGRLNYESEDYSLFKPLLGAGKLRAMFGV